MTKIKKSKRKKNRRTEVTLDELVAAIEHLPKLDRGRLKGATARKI